MKICNESLTKEPPYETIKAIKSKILVFRCLLCKIQSLNLYELIHLNIRNGLCLLLFRINQFEWPVLSMPLMMFPHLFGCDCTVHLLLILLLKFEKWIKTFVDIYNISFQTWLPIKTWFDYLRDKINIIIAFFDSKITNSKFDIMFCLYRIR
jgi:hypothetical protein